MIRILFSDLVSVLRHAETGVVEGTPFWVSEQIAVGVVVEAVLRFLAQSVKDMPLGIMVEIKIYRNAGLHDAVDVEIDYLYAEPADPDFRPVSPRNRPEAVICAYHTRMKQFALFAQANGAAFISGFQPWITSKRALTPREQERLHTYNPYYQLVYSNMPMLNDMYDKLLDEERLPYVLNLHRYFGQLGDEETHFGDELLFKDKCKAILVRHQDTEAC